MRVCSGAGCLRAIPDDDRYCVDCKPVGAPADDGIKQHLNGYTPELDRLRKSGRWQALRARIVRRDPLCRRCGKRATGIIDHIIPAQVALQQARDSGRYLFDRNAGYFLDTNLQGLCRECHWDKTLEDKRHSGPWPSVLRSWDAAPPKQYRF